MDPTNQVMKLSEELHEEEVNGNSNSSQYDLDEDITLKSSAANLNHDDWEDDDPFSAPFEILAEFLSALMVRDYPSALHYSELILQFEPDNVTVQEFQPLIEEKIRLESESSTTTEESAGSSDNSRESTDYYSSVSSMNSSSSNGNEDDDEEEEEEDKGDECDTCIVNENASDSILSVSSSENETTNDEREQD